MTTTSTQYAQTITQSSGGEYSQWTNIDKLKKKGGAAMTAVIEPSTGFKDTPAALNFTDFGLQVPSGTKIRKLTVEYAHDKVKAKYNSTSFKWEPCTTSVADQVICSKRKHCSVPAPKIQVKQKSSSNGTVIGDFTSVAQGSVVYYEKKGQAPTEATKEQSVVFDFGLDSKLTPQFFNNLAIQFDYGRNTSKKHHGYVRLYYVRVKVEYVFPNYAVSAQTANTADKIYNNDEYHLKVTCSDSNITRQSQNITIEAPSGFSFRSYNGNGTVTRSQNRIVTWAPNMNSGSATVELIFDINVGFSGTDTTVSKTFNLGMTSTGWTGSHTITVYKRTAPISGDTEESTDYSSKTDDPEPPGMKTVTVDEEFTYTLEFTELSITSLIQDIFEYGVSKGWFTGTLDDNYEDIVTHTRVEFMSDVTQSVNTWLSKNHKLAAWGNPYGTYEWTKIAQARQLNTIMEGNNNVELLLKASEDGYDEIISYAYYANATTLHTSDKFDLFVWKFNIRPPESSLTVPNMTLLTLSDEEIDRLGDGYTYTLQSYLKQVTTDTYVRDWYKNLRFGVFNNRIEANCSTFYQWNNQEDSFEGYLQLPPRFSIDDAYFILTVDKAIGLNINDTDYTLSDNDTETIDCFDEYDMSTVFTKDTEDTVNLTMTLYDSNDTELYAIDYQINFGAETNEFKPVTIDTSDYEHLTDEEIFNGAAYWGNPPKEVNTYESVECEFTHNKDYPFYIIVTGDYPEGDQSNNDIIFTEPCIVESSVYTERLENGIYPIAIDDLILNDGSTAEVTLSANNQSDTIVFYDYPLDDNYGTNTSMAVRGIELVGNVEQGDEIVLYSQLKSPDGESRQRSIILNNADTTLNKHNSFSIGGNGDLWGFSTLDMVNMEDWETELTISNTLSNSESSLTFGDVYLIFHVEQVDQQEAKVYIEGEDIAYYGAFVTDAKVPEGLETDTKFLDIDGTDTNDCYRQNIREKTIKLEFEIGDNCSLTEATESLRQLTKLLVNERDEYNRPIPKRLQLSHYPEVYWEYVMEKPLDADLELSSYNCKAELTIPAGTSYDLENTTTASTGYVNGIASVNPNIIVKPISEIITIREAVSEQEFNMGYAGGWEDKILEVDCENRIVWLKESEDDTEAENLNKYVDFNSDWFSIIGEYAFEGTGCIIRTVDYQERW